MDAKLKQLTSMVERLVSKRMKDSPDKLVNNFQEFIQELIKMEDKESETAKHLYKKSDEIYGQLEKYIDKKSVFFLMPSMLMLNSCHANGNLEKCDFYFDKIVTYVDSIGHSIFLKRGKLEYGAMIESFCQYGDLLSVTEQSQEKKDEIFKSMEKVLERIDTSGKDIFQGRYLLMYVDVFLINEEITISFSCSDI